MHVVTGNGTSSVQCSCGRAWSVWTRKKPNPGWGASFDATRTYRLLYANAERHAHAANRAEAST